MDDRTVGSMCTGVGGLELAIGLPALWHAEINEAPSRVLKRRWPDVPNLGDVTSVDWQRVARPDVLLAGFPCQGSSIAGRRRGRADERWLWPHVAEAIRVLRPGGIVIENVPNLLRVDDGEAFGEILSDLTRAGYAVRWTVVGACAVGLAHHRHRLFVRALPASACRQPAPQRWPAAGVLAGGHVYVLPHPKCGAPPRGAAPLFPTPTARDGDGRGEGSAEYWEAHRRTCGVPLGAAVALLPTPRASDGVNGGPNQRGSKGDLALPSAVQPQYFGKYAAAVDRHVATTGVAPPAPTEPNSNGNPRLSSCFVQWLMDYPDGWVTGELDRLEAITALGNAVVPRQARHAYGMLCEPLNL